MKIKVQVEARMTIKTHIEMQKMKHKDARKL